MTNSEKLLALYDEIIVNRYIDEKDVMKEWYERYKTFLESVQVRTLELKNGKKLDYDNGDQEFLDLFFISSNPVSSRGSNPISDEDLRAILRSNEFTSLIEETMLNPNKKSWDTLIEKGKSIFKRSHSDNQPLRFNRISASCTSKLIPMPSENAFNKFVKYLNDNAILDFTNIEKNWYAQNEYLTKKFHEIFNNKILDENDFTDEYWLNLFAWSLYDKKVNQSESDVGNSEMNPSKGTKKLNQPLNRILFGAAGTGKTFNTINHALSIIDNKSLEELETEDRAELKSCFDNYKNQGQIKFVTFHQSFSYEDFVEGIRAETDDQGNLTYDVKSGVFKEICDLAKATVKSNIDNKVDLDKKKVWKMSLGRAGVEDDLYRSCLDNNVILLGWGDAIDFTQCEDVSSIKNKLNEINYPKESEETTASYVNTFINKIQIGDLVVVTDGNLKFRAIAEVIANYEYDENQEYGYHQLRRVKWLKTFSPSLKNENYFNKIFSQSTVYNLENALDKEKLALLLQPEERTSSNLNNKYVLIIDEINRGNISRIFGELITLIEDSKRQGAEEWLSVTLPYSKEEFSVPNNVYIIGTMNSSDRSLTGLDIALRRRFTFIEMPPKPELLNDIEIDGLNVGELLKVINQRIEVLLDRDHCIGHANFMSLNKQRNLEHLAEIFRQKIIPQLQEYFFDDWAKINMVFNANGMLKSKPVERSILFPNVDSESEGFCEEQKAWQLVDSAFDSIASFSKIIKH